MNITINVKYVEDIIGAESLNQLLTIITINKYVLWYIVPWLSTIVVVMNMLVVILCSLIYVKTGRNNHKPAFVFIGTLALADVLLGG